MKRIRWFAADWPISLRTLASKMKAHAFNEDSTNGFIIDRVRDSFINGRYVEKIVFQETLTTPFGAEQVLDRVVYRQLEFTLFSSFPNIELWDAPRSTQGYVSKLTELNNFNVALLPLSVDVLKWVSAFQERITSNVTIDSLQISGLELEPSVIARISINAERDVRDALHRLAKGRSFNLDRVQMKLIHKGRRISIQLTNSGTAKIDESLVEELLPALRQSIPTPTAY